MSFGSMSTQTPIQQLYGMMLTANMMPYMGQTASGMNEMGQNAVNTFQGIPDWERYMGERYNEPASYQLQNALGDLRHSKEMFSSAYQNRKASMYNQYNQQLSQMAGQEMMGQRGGQLSGMEQGLARQMQAIQQFNQTLGMPLQVQGVENAVGKKTLFGGG